MRRLFVVVSLVAVLAQLALAGRYYDARTGRFLQVDPKAHELPGVTPYNYGLNNPLKFIDPNGQFPYTFHIRSFAPTGAFKGTGYHDDARGYSTSTGVTSRIKQSFTVDPTARTFSGGKPSSDPTYWNGIKFQPTNPSGNASPTFGNNSLGSSTAAVASEFSGSNPTPVVSLVAPNINVNSAIAITENLKAGTVNVSIDVSSKQFPATEAFVADASGNSVFLGGGAAFGAAIDLYGSGTSQISSVDLVIGINGDGIFQSVSFNGNTYSLADWNKMLTSQSAGPFPREDKDK